MDYQDSEQEKTCKDCDHYLPRFGADGVEYGVCCWNGVEGDIVGPWDKPCENYNKDF